MDTCEYCSDKRNFEEIGVPLHRLSPGYWYVKMDSGNTEIVSLIECMFGPDAGKLWVFFFAEEEPSCPEYVDGVFIAPVPQRIL